MATAFARTFFPARHFTPGQFGPEGGASAPYLTIRTGGTGQASGVGRLLIGVTFRVDDLAQAGGSVRLIVPIALRVAGIAIATGAVRIVTGDEQPGQEQPQAGSGGKRRRRLQFRPLEDVQDEAEVVPVTLRVAGKVSASGAVAMTVAAGLTVAGHGYAHGFVTVEATDPVTADNAFWLMAA